MDKHVRRIFIEKKKGFDIEAKQLFNDLSQNLGIRELTEVRIANRYHIQGVSKEAYEKALVNIFSEPNIDTIYEESLPLDGSYKVFGIEYLPGQYDQRADSAAQCIEILTTSERPIINTAKIIMIKGNITDDEFRKIKKYCINPVDSREASLDKPETLEDNIIPPKDVEVLNGFIQKSLDELIKFKEELGLTMSIDDVLFCQEYFKLTEKRNPTITEIKVIDTYWSDHCRHTTFMTEIEEVNFDNGLYGDSIKSTYQEYLNSRDYVYGEADRPICLMDMATIGMKELRKRGLLDDLDVSDEINACSINVNVDVDGKIEKWLVMFKNETHNHPTEIEPFGGAATCLGGAIRDPLSGRSYVYQAMRITGSGDPRQKIEDTLLGKLPQRKITTEAARGYSSYGNQIGIATGHVSEIYHQGYVAKRMELGAVIGATPKENVVRKVPKEGDLVVLVGGRTGRDGCGGATGSSKSHTDDSILNSGAEVQKGNPLIERNILRLFRKSDFSRIIKKCNDFGAGGVSVAIGELADSLEINLDKVLTKYEGLDGTELAISESQERMAVVIDKDHLHILEKHVEEENLEATVIAQVKSNNRLIMKWRNNTILDIDRDFLNTNGVRQKTKAHIVEPVGSYYDRSLECLEANKGDVKSAWIRNLKTLNLASQKGLVERFDSTVGAGTVLLPFGGKYSLTPSLGMASKVPVLKGETNTCTLMTYGFDPELSTWSPYHGGLYAVVDSVAKVVAMGGDHRKIRLTFQEYFEKLGDDSKKWGKPLAALLGAYKAQKEFMIPSIGGKDSMSGTFNDLNVPPTLVSFAVCVEDARDIISPEFKKAGSKIILVSSPRLENGLPDFEILNKNLTRVHELIKSKKILSAYNVGIGGIAGAISKMSFGNKIGIEFIEDIEIDQLFSADYGSILLEINSTENLEKLFEGIEYKILGCTKDEPVIIVNNTKIHIDDAIKEWEEPLNEIFPIKKSIEGKPNTIYYDKGNMVKAKYHIAKPKVFIPIFPGTNCEYDMERAFRNAGGEVDTFVFKNLTPEAIKESIDIMAKKIKTSQIIALPGGFSAGDEPDGSGKFIGTVFRNPYISEAIMELLKNRDGLILGICNGFQALIKLGLVPYGEIRDMKEDSPTLAFNNLGRHVSRMVQTKVVSNLSPWFNNVNIGDVFTIPISHGEGRLVADDKTLEEMIKKGQVATQYVDFEGNPSYDGEFNPNGSLHSIEGITSPDGRVLGKMAHSERIGKDLYKNMYNETDQKLFEAGIRYFR